LRTRRTDEWEAWLLQLKIRNTLLAEVVVRQRAERLREELLKEPERDKREKSP